MFAAAALAFLLPFGTVSCGEETVSFTGVELATYDVAGGDEPDSLAADVEAHGFYALITLAVALVGAGVAAVWNRGGGYAVTGLCGLYVLAVNPDTLLGPEIEWGPGFVLAGFAFLLAGAARLYVRVEERARTGTSSRPLIIALVLGVPVTAIALPLLGIGAA